MRNKTIIAVCVCIIIAISIILISLSINNTPSDITDDTNTTVKKTDEFTVRFTDLDNSEIITVKVKDGDNVYPPDAPEHEGYIFRGWDKELTDIHGNITIRAMYEAISVSAIVVDSVYIPSNEKTVLVKISILNNPGIASTLFDIKYDDILTLEKIDFSSGFGDYITAPEPYSNPQTISMISPVKDIDSSGEFAIMTFSVKEKDIMAETYTADISVMYNKDNTFDSDFNSIFFETVNGKITIIK